MAVDSAAKRISVPRGPIGIPGMPGWMTPPIPDGTIDAGDRQQIAGVYRGISAGAPSAPITRLPKGLMLGVYP